MTVQATAQILNVTWASPVDVNSVILFGLLEATQQGVNLSYHLVHLFMYQLLIHSLSSWVQTMM